MLAVFLILAFFVFVAGAGVTLVVGLYGGFILGVFFVSEFLNSKKPEMRLPFLVACSSILLALLLGELGFRIAFDSKIFYRAHEKYFELSPEFYSRYRYTPHVQSERLIFGDLAARTGAPPLKAYRYERFVTDARGFRNDDSRDLPIEVLVLGDSFASGADTTQEAGWARLLREKSGVSLYNLSLPGSPAHELYVLESELPRLKLAPEPILIWMLFAGNDLFESYEGLDILEHDFHLTPLESLVVQIINIQNRSAITRTLQRLSWVDHNLVVPRNIAGLGNLLFYRPYIDAMGLSATDYQQLPEWKNLIRTFERMSVLTSRHGIRVLVVVAPSKEEVYLRSGADNLRSSMAAALEGACIRFTFDCVDLKPFLVARTSAKDGANPELLWWPDDTHWNVEGNRAVADFIYSALRGKLQKLNPAQ